MSPIANLGWRQGGLDPRGRFGPEIDEVSRGPHRLQAMIEDAPG